MVLKSDDGTLESKKLAGRIEMDNACIGGEKPVPLLTKLKAIARENIRKNGQPKKLK